MDKGAEFIHGEEDNIVFHLVSPFNLSASYMPLMAAEKHLYADITGHQYNNTEVHSLVDKAHEILNQDYSGYNGSDGSVAGYFYPRYLMYYLIKACVS